MDTTLSSAPPLVGPGAPSRTDPWSEPDNPCRPRHFKPDLATAPIEGPLKQSIETGRTRLMVTGALFSIAFAVIGARLIDVTLLRSGELRIPRSTAVKQVAFGRSDIVDRNGTLIATTLAAPSLFANPHQITDPAGTAKKLAEILPTLSEQEAFTKLSADKSFVWLHRLVTPRQQYEINRLGIPGLQFEREERRVYPQGSLTAHVVGYSGIDNKGLAGIERSFEEVLKGGKEPLRLSIDMRVQHVVHEELVKSIETYNAIGGTGIVIDVRTGELMSLVSLPDFDPNQPGTANPETIFNRATLGTYEMGSTFKIFNSAMALDSGKITLSNTYDATRPISIGRFSINDSHPTRRWLNVAEIFLHSSNIGSARMAVEMGADAQKEFLGRIGLLRVPSIEIPEVGTPLVPKLWREINTMTIAFGHGVSVSALQTVVAASAMINGGVLRPATLIKHADGYVPAGQQVISPRTSDQMRRLFRMNVENSQGSGTKAAVPGYLVGGKTGSAEKVAHKGYSKKAVLTSFIAAFPMNDPKYLVMIMLDEPKGTRETFNFALAGWNAAPTAGRVVQRMAPLLGIKPVNEQAPEVHRALDIDLPGLGRKIAAN